MIDSNARKIKFLIIAILLLSVLAACTKSVKLEELRGEWKYTRLEQPNDNPPSVTPEEELKSHDPSIRFGADSSLVILWDGKQLSHGTFRLEGPIIRYTEILEGGKSRTFPFLIREIDEEVLVFETMEESSVRVTATRVKEAE